MISTFYRGSVKDLLGPVAVRYADPQGGQPVNAGGIVFEYSDAYSVFDWGRMPDALPGKGASLAIMAAYFFEQLSKPETWKEFSRTQEALRLRRGNRFGSGFNELGEQLQQTGMKSHYLGLLPSVTTEQLDLRKLPQLEKPVKHLLVRQVAVNRPTSVKVLGRDIPDYTPTRSSPAPRLVPLEVIFRFTCPAGSSLRSRIERDPEYLAARGFGAWKLDAEGGWDFPVLELFTKLESSDRPVTLEEALSISGLTAPQLQDVLFRTAWVAGYLRARFAALGLELADGKLEWALDESGESLLVDAIGPDELRVLVPGEGLQLSKEFLRSHYRTTLWYDAIELAKKKATEQGTSDWKRLANVAPPALPQEYREVAVNLYPALANSVTGTSWFPSAWPLKQLIEKMRELSSGEKGQGA